jgi:uncharacterized protein YdhG (YjbR/CyaY superfamily)
MVVAVGVLDDYFENLDPAARSAFEHVRQLAMDVAPAAEQGTSYGMAALKHEGRPLLGFRAAKQHLSIFPFGPAAVDSVRDRLRGFDLSKGTIRFSAAQPLPDDVVRDVVRFRLAEIERG